MRAPATLAAGSEALGPQVRFAGKVPSPGTYRFFPDFPQGGTVRTAVFTVDAPERGPR